MCVLAYTISKLPWANPVTLAGNMGSGAMALPIPQPSLPTCFNEEVSGEEPHLFRCHWSQCPGSTRERGEDETLTPLPGCLIWFAILPYLRYGEIPSIIISIRLLEKDFKMLRKGELRSHILNAREMFSHVVYEIIHLKGDYSWMYWAEYFCPRTQISNQHRGMWKAAKWAMVWSTSAWVTTQEHNYLIFHINPFP